ncbi:DUF6011 domain-containing protein [Virgibacillus halophilus]|uniref:DUF6011 domain-containing protein n=1 Tax=Tigheibacillus halophilus TaxID=361280 RepID=A0ABU5C7V9_9BACI|nr:DUF6011 domain-containing protein [Virgibacillus halophilus]
MELCGRCKRGLKSSKSIKRGFGPVCYKKHKQEEFERNQMTIEEFIGGENDHD